MVPNRTFESSLDVKLPIYRNFFWNLAGVFFLFLKIKGDAFLESVIHKVLSRVTNNMYQQTFFFSKSTVETLEKVVKYVQS